VQKISIIGRGTAGCISAAHFLYHTDCYIDFYYDNNIKPQAVGEGSTLILPTRLHQTINFRHEDLSLIDGSFKYGIKKTGWGLGTEFTHNFAPPGVGYHFNAIKLQEFILKQISSNPRIRIIDDHVDHNKIDSEYILDCAGKPNNYDGYTMAESIPVNSVYVTQCYWDYAKFQHTLTLARPHGWVFGIPLQNRCSIGYLYNSNINSLDDIKADVKHIFEDYKLTPSENTNSFSFQNYYKNTNFSGRTAYNGNSSFFLEPLEATSISFMDTVNRLAYDVWFNGLDQNLANQYYNKHITEIENVIMLHYFSGSQFNTEFWKFAKSKGESNMKHAMNNKKFTEMIDASKLNNPKLASVEDYGTWHLNSFCQNLHNLGLYDKFAQLRKFAFTF
jgi:tryptophan halogenase